MHHGGKRDPACCPQRSARWRSRSPLPASVAPCPGLPLAGLFWLAFGWTVALG